jgi:hypothetical protein
VLLTIYEWNAWWQFKLVRAVPEAVRLTTRPGEDADEVLAHCPPNATAFAFHINATFTGEFPHRRRALVNGLEARGIVPINAEIVDISKRWVQAQCAACGLPVAAATADGHPDERLIVKTNHNFGGRSERLLTPAQLAALQMPAPSPTVPDAKTYQVVRRRNVPAAWWTDPALAIERYVENRWNRIYRVSFAGRRFDVLRMVNTEVIKKVLGSTQKTVILCTHDDLARGAVAGVEAEVAAAVARFVDWTKMDFGGIDIVMDDDGRAYVIDVNTTPFGALNAFGRLMSIRRGLFELIAERAPHLRHPLLGIQRSVWPSPPMVLNALLQWAAPARSTGH